MIESESKKNVNNTQWCLLQVGVLVCAECEENSIQISDGVDLENQLFGRLIKNKLFQK